MSSVPRAVLEAEANADKLLEELNQQRQQQLSEPPAGDPPPSDPPADNSVPPTPANDSQPPANAQAQDDWEHRFKVLQGKYNSEVPRFAEQVKELKNRLDSLESENQQLKAKPPESLVTPEDVEQYGDGLIDVARRIAQEELAKKQAEIDALKLQLTQVQETTANTVQKDFFKSLIEMVPDWQQVNEDPAFLKWLDEIDELTGAPRQELLSRAEKTRDAVRVAKFFTSFKKTSSTWAANSNNALESQIVPNTNRTPDAPPAKKIWLRSEITEFYNRLRRNEVSDADAIAIEADITAAQIEGRIR